MIALINGATALTSSVSRCAVYHRAALLDDRSFASPSTDGATIDQWRSLGVNPAPLRCRQTELSIDSAALTTDHVAPSIDSATWSVISAIPFGGANDRSSNSAARSTDSATTSGCCCVYLLVAVEWKLHQRRQLAGLFAQVAFNQISLLFHNASCSRSPEQIQVRCVTYWPDLSKRDPSYYKNSSCRKRIAPLPMWSILW